MKTNEIDDNTKIVKASEVKEIIYYWDYEKNKYKLEELTIDRQVFVYFKCPDCGKEWGKPLKRFYESDRKCPECRKRAILVINNENIMKFWNYEMNQKYDPNKLTIFSREKPNFICKDCGYEWSVEITGRKNKSECPKCNGHYRQMTYDEEYPRIAERYSPNNPKPLNELTGTDRKEYILMICPKHGEYESQLGNLISNYNSPALGCPKCYNQDTALEDSLFVKCPDIARDLQNFDPKKIRYGSRKHGKFICSIHGEPYEGKIANVADGGTRCPTCRRLKSLANFRPDLEKWLDPEYGEKLEDYLPQSNKDLHFICKLKHKFKYVIYDLPDADEFDCPICLGRIIEPGFNDVATFRPELVKEWSSKNEISLSTAHKGSHYEGLWVCPECGYEYPLEIRKRFLQAYNPCPVCKGRIVISGINDLVTKHPELVDRLSDELKPVANKILFKETKWLRWKCPTCKGEYPDSIGNIVAGNNNCPYCSGKKLLSGYNDLASVHPEIVEKLSPEFRKTASEILCKENKYLEWICPICHGQYYDSIINVLTGNDNCPYCKGKKLLPGFNDFKTLYPELAEEWHPTNKYIGLEPDKILPKSNEKAFFQCPKCDEIYPMAIQNRVIKYKRHKEPCPRCGRTRPKSLYFAMKKHR